MKVISLPCGLFTILSFSPLDCSFSHATTNYGACEVSFIGSVSWDSVHHIVFHSRLKVVTDSIMALTNSRDRVATSSRRQETERFYQNGMDNMALDGNGVITKEEPYF